MAHGTRWLMVAAALLTAACSDSAGTSPGTMGTSTTTTAPATTTTVAASTTSTSSSTTTSTVPLPEWHYYPVGPVNTYPKPSVGSATVGHIDTLDPVVFLTLDDGIVRDPRILPLLQQHGVPVTMFLNAGPIRQDAAYFADLLQLGGSINSHTLSHPKLKGMSLDDQKYQICGDREVVINTYGAGNGDFLRPPYGEYDSNTLKAAASCGIRVVVTWNVVIWEGHISTIGDHGIHPGDIILGHFRVDLYDSLVYLFSELDRLGLKVARLEDYLPAG